MALQSMKVKVRGNIQIWGIICTWCNSTWNTSVWVFYLKKKKKNPNSHQHTSSMTFWESPSTSSPFHNPKIVAKLEMKPPESNYAKLQLQITNICKLIILPLSGTLWSQLYLHCPLIAFHILLQSILLLTICCT